MELQQVQTKSRNRRGLCTSRLDLFVLRGDASFFTCCSFNCLEDLAGLGLGDISLFWNKNTEKLILTENPGSLLVLRTGLKFSPSITILFWPFAWSQSLKHSAQFLAGLWLMKQNSFILKCLNYRQTDRGNLHHAIKMGGWVSVVKLLKLQTFFEAELDSGESFLFRLPVSLGSDFTTTFSDFSAFTLSPVTLKQFWNQSNIIYNTKKFAN